MFYIPFWQFCHPVVKNERKMILIHPFKKLKIFRHAFHIQTAILYSTFLPVGTFKTAKICICPTTKETKMPRGFQGLEGLSV
jgi:hypothetical protein